jgi:uncharacterized protein (DUF58 family)
MPRLDPSPWLAVVIPYLLAVAYLTYRGLARNEFRAPGKSGWARYRAGSADWLLSTVLNLLLTVAGLFMLWAALFDGAAFTREPVLKRPEASGALVQNVRVDRSPGEVVRCLTELNHAQTYENGRNSWLIAVRNGRNSVMYTFEVTTEGSGSRVEVRRRRPSPFVTWAPCFRSGTEIR